MFTGLFICEGNSDAPLADIVESLFRERGIPVRITAPDFRLLSPRVPKDVCSRMRAGVKLIGAEVDFIICHRDADNQGVERRRSEMTDALAAAGFRSLLVPIIPVRMTEAWLLLDAHAIRTVAGVPNGTTDLGLPKRNEVEGIADPKKLLQEVILQAANVTGRRRERLAQRFASNRRQLLERLDRLGPVTELPSWQQLVADVEIVSQRLKDG